MRLTKLFSLAIENLASDIHLSAGSEPSIRVDGLMTKTKFPAFTEDTLLNALEEIMTPSAFKIFTTDKKDVDFAYTFNETRFRVNAFYHRSGPGAVFRLISTFNPSLEEINAPEILKRLSTLQTGLVLLTGPTGSGKSTTQAAILQYINATEQKHVITLEDPIEFIHNNDNSIITQREIFSHCDSFADALRSALREDPDIIVVGEMRDTETIKLALTAAETGHLVIGTLHTASCSKAISRIIDAFPTAEKDLVRSMLAESLQGVIRQSLLPKAGGKGRVAAFEVLIATSAVRNMIRQDNLQQIESVLQTGKSYGMCSIKQSIQHLFDQGLIDQEDAIKAFTTLTIT